jgi:hypothetical protein
MKPDPIVEEIHAIREKISMQYGNDLHTICEAFRAAQKLSDHPIVSLQPKLAQLGSARDSAPAALRP